MKTIIILVLLALSVNAAVDVSQCVLQSLSGFAQLKPMFNNVTCLLDLIPIIQNEHNYIVFQQTLLTCGVSIPEVEIDTTQAM
jgi:hypothetical protein